MTFKMDPAIRDRWVAALRSGKYTQTTGNLGSGGSHCCLGVLCELAVEDRVVVKEESGAGLPYNYVGPRPIIDENCSMSWRSSKVLPGPVIEWAGIDAENPSDPIVEYEGLPRPLSLLNDDQRLPFTDIAAIIEKATTTNEEVK